MKKSFTTTLALLVVFGAMVGWYFLYEKKYRVEKTEKEEQGKKLVSIEAKDARFIDLERLTNPMPEGVPGTPDKPSLEKISLKKVGEDWHLILPIEDLADNAAVDTLLNAVGAAKQERVVDEAPKDLAAYGLTVPVVKVTVRAEEAGKGQELLLGNHTPIGQGTYAMIAGQTKVARVPKWVRGSLEKEGHTYRNKAIFKGTTRADIAELEVQKGASSMILKKEEGKESWILSRDNAPASTDEANKAVNTLVDLKATAFPDMKGLGSPSLKVTLTKQDKSRLTIALVKKGDKYYAKRDDKATVFEIAKEPFETLERPTDKYRNMNLASFNRFDVTRVKLEHGAETLDLVKDNSNWSTPTDPAAKIDGKKVDNLLVKLQDTKLSKYLPAGKKVATPALVIRLFEKKDNAESERLTLKFAKEAAKEHVVERSDIQLPFAIKAEDFKAIYLQKKDLIQVEKAAETADKKEKKS